MKKKSKFVTFILSIIPGFGHFYLGLFTRGLFFILAIIADIGIAVILDWIFYGDTRFLPILAIPLIWLAAVIDSINLVDKINSNIQYSNMQYSNSLSEQDINQKNNLNFNEENTMQNNKINTNNKLVISMFLSIIPGAGHMYLGIMRKGMELMAAFFLAFYLTDFLRISLFMMAVPIIWFYSMFDVMHKVSLKEEINKNEMLMISKFGFTNNYGKLFGIALVFIGLVLILQQMALPVVNEIFGYQIGNYVRTGIIAVLFIAGGVKLLIGSKGQEE